MGAASRIAMETVRGTLRTLDTRGSSTVASELLSAASLLGSSRRLRSALSDPSANRSAKQRLVSSVFRSFNPTTIEVLQTIAAARWSDSRGLVAAVAETGQRAAASSAPEGVDVASELLEVGRIVASNAELELALGSRAASDEAKGALVERIFGASVSEQTLAIVRELATRHRGRRFHTLVASAAAVVADELGFGLATVSSAVPLDEEHTRAISERLTAIYGRRFELNTVVDAATEGGVRIAVGNDVYDGTISTRLAELRLQLAG
ncbi:F0F1 ATP synthase subunit delta [Labedella endophytica]|uniref:ATP synthase subunit delta n=1 Tax=Labedella endophytica TaxID=1523160 RepID=A0A3S0XN85_9MICO|nr:F0F1 ATP synthase subunit delta [Labedella endophytica]RUR01159.1 F0F1 ATP synthase subunit delta [Labedella endophytica]